MHDTAGETITEKLLEPGIPDCRLTSVGVLQTQTLSYVRNSMKDHESCHHIMWSQLCDVQVFMDVTSSFTHVSLTFCNQRFNSCKPTI
jgi:hypothetical protein